MQKVNDMLKEYLEKDGRTCMQVFSGSEAKLLLEKHSFDLILLDLMLPAISGEQILKEIKNNGSFNLISNSLKHGNGDLTIIQQKNEIIISNSIRTSVEIDLDKVFERFYKADVSRSNISSGLGLTIAQKAIQLMGGDIIASIDGDMFCITIKLDKRNYI